MKIIQSRRESEQYIINKHNVSMAHEIDHDYGKLNDTVEHVINLNKDTSLFPSPTNYYYAAGDNVDVSVVPSYMTSINQRQIHHCFITLGIRKRVSNPSLAEGSPKYDITSVNTCTWLPTIDDLSSYEQNLDHYVLQVILNFKCMNFLTDVVEKHIMHPYVEITKQPTEYHVVDLSSNNENTSDGMINIMKEVQSLFVPRDHNNPPNVLDSTKFAGDVLTNERSLSAQESMMNHNASTYEKLMGLNYRPGGLHIMMNLVGVFCC